MIPKSASYCNRKPCHKHVDVFSATAATTAIVTAQGIQALYNLMLGIGHISSNNYKNLAILNYIFVPLAIIGLFRLLPAYWLADDYSFASIDTLELIEGNSHGIATGESIFIDPSVAPLLNSTSTRRRKVPPFEWLVKHLTAHFLPSYITRLMGNDCILHLSFQWRSIFHHKPADVYLLYFLPHYHPRDFGLPLRSKETQGQQSFHV
jgi:hypothetical protein